MAERGKENPFSGKSVHYTLWSHNMSDPQSQAYIDQFFQDTLDKTMALPRGKRLAVLLEATNLTESQEKRVVDAIGRGVHPTRAFVEGAFRRSVSTKDLVEGRHVVGNKTPEFIALDGFLKKVGTRQVNVAFDGKPDKDPHWDQLEERFESSTKAIETAMNARDFSLALQIFKDSRYALTELASMRDIRTVKKIKGLLTRGKNDMVSVLVGSAHVSQVKMLQKEGIFTTVNYLEGDSHDEERDMPLVIKTSERIMDNPQAVIDELTWKQTLISFSLDKMNPGSNKELLERERRIIAANFSTMAAFRAFENELVQNGINALRRRIV